jgi:hypothetical protein
MSGRLRTVHSCCTPAGVGHDQVGETDQAKEGAVIGRGDDLEPVSRGTTWSRSSAGVRPCRVATSWGLRGRPVGQVGQDAYEAFVSQVISGGPADYLGARRNCVPMPEGSG